MAHLKATVGIIVKNEAAHVGEALDHVLASEFPADQFEVVVVDGHSTDGTVRIVTATAQRDSRIRLIPEPWPRGTHGMARNLVADNARGLYLAFTDGDCLVDRTWLATLVARLDSERALDPSVVGAGGSRTPAATTSWRENLINTALGTFLGSGGSHGFVTTSARYTDSIPNYNAVYVTAIVRQERYSRLGVGDDYEFNTRLGQRGYKLAFEPRAVVRHHQEGSFRALVRQSFRYGEAQVRVFALRRKMRRFAPLAGLFTTGVLVGPLFVLVSRPLFATFLAVMGLYGSVALLTAVRNALRQHSWLGLLTALLYPALHFSYGWGVLHGALAASAGRLSIGPAETGSL